MNWAELEKYAQAMITRKHLHYLLNKNGEGTNSFWKLESKIKFYPAFPLWTGLQNNQIVDEIFYFLISCSSYQSLVSISKEIRSILWPPDERRRLTGEDTDAGKDWRQEEKGITEDETVG